MGDGNHSFATAKEVWEQIKSQAGGLQHVADHPARHALVELVNLHDDGLTFEPIHRVVFNVDHRALLALGQRRGDMIDLQIAAAPDEMGLAHRSDLATALNAAQTGKVRFGKRNDQRSKVR